MPETAISEQPDETITVAEVREMMGPGHVKYSDGELMKKYALCVLVARDALDLARRARMGETIV